MSKSKSKKKPVKKPRPIPREGRALGLRLSDAEHAALERRTDANMRTAKQQALWEMKQGALPPPPTKSEGPSE